MSRHLAHGVVLMTYGSPASLERDDIHAYLKLVRGGREPAAELVDEFTRRYRLIGGSPLVEITRRQAEALQAQLGWPVRIGMRFSEPSIARGLRELAELGVRSVAAIVLSPQYSPMLMGGYARALEAARAGLGDRSLSVSLASAWYDEPALAEALATRVRDVLRRFDPAERGPVVLLTAHSLPRHVAEQEPGYLEQLRGTARLVAERAGLSADRWRFCWQSAGHEPGEWMKPDLAEIMPELAAAGESSVVVAPVQFVADHVEVLYDVDVGAREQAERYRLRFVRVESLNLHPRFIDALAKVARSTVIESAGAPATLVGQREPRDRVVRVGRTVQHSKTERAQCDVPPREAELGEAPGQRRLGGT